MKIINDVFQQLLKHHQTISVAESCTGGGLAHEITSIAGVSSIFLGGMVTYANEAKINLLHIPRTIISTHGAVSKEVAVLMAKNVQKEFGSTWALSTTGIAGPGGGTKEKPVGLVFIGIAGPQVHNAVNFTFDNSSRLEHRQKTIEQAFLLLQHHLPL